MSGPVLILAGGTGGHIFPGLAVARALRERSVAVEWLGAEGAMETRLVPAAGLALHTLRVRGLRGGGLLRRLLAPLMLLRALFGALALLHRLQPRCVLSFGGFAAGPGGLAAWLLRRPLLVHESNRAPGLTNRVLARLARRRLVGMPGTFASEEVTGNPVRAEIAALPAPAVRPRHEGPVRLLVLGGSQGARALNLHLAEALRASGVCCEIRHQTGAQALDSTAQRYAEAGLRADTVAFVDDMAEAYRWADLVVCRAGASTLAELCAVGLPALLVPLPSAADDHQNRNADWLVEAGAALKIEEGEGFAGRLGGALADVACQPARAQRMAEAARALARIDAAERVAEACIEEARA